MTGKGVVSSIWDSIDNLITKHRHLWMALTTDPGFLAVLEIASGTVPFVTNVGQILDEQEDWDGPCTLT